MTADPAKILILGGTAEAAALARHLTAEFGPRLVVITSLAGRTAPPELPGQIRSGGFGGVDGLADYLTAHNITAMVDATHPYAAQISAHAQIAAQRTQTPRLLLHRPPWREQPGDAWVKLPDLDTAAQWLELMGPSLRGPALLSVGHGGVAPFAEVTNLNFVVRLLAQPAEPLPLARHRVVIARPPYNEDGEARLFAEHGIGALVTKNSGGAATVAKLAVARTNRVPVLMIKRPPPPPGDTVETTAAAISWLRGYCPSSS